MSPFLLQDKVVGPFRASSEPAKKVEEDYAYAIHNALASSYELAQLDPKQFEKEKTTLFHGREDDYFEVFTRYIQLFFSKAMADARVYEAQRMRGRPGDPAYQEARRDASTSSEEFFYFYSKLLRLDPSVEKRIVVPDELWQASALSTQFGHKPDEVLRVAYVASLVNYEKAREVFPLQREWLWITSCLPTQPLSDPYLDACLHLELESIRPKDKPPVKDIQKALAFFKSKIKNDFIKYFLPNKSESRHLPLDEVVFLTKLDQIRQQRSKE
jgi:hypothetical protein